MDQPVSDPPSGPHLKPYGTIKPKHTAPERQSKDAYAKQQYGYGDNLHHLLLSATRHLRHHKAAKVNGLYMAGLYDEAVNAANEAKKWSLIGIIAGLVIQLIWCGVYGYAAFASL